jgi:hypothetical protein
MQQAHLEKLNISLDGLLQLERIDALAVPNANRDNAYTSTPSAISECSSSICATPEAPSWRTTIKLPDRPEPLLPVTVPWSLLVRLDSKNKALK